jgi:hypothetical protein
MTPTLDARVPVDLALAAFGLPATVEVSGCAPIATRAFWLPPRIDALPSAGTLQRSEAIRLLVLPRTDVLELPRGARITVAEIAGGQSEAWVVEGRDFTDTDHVRVTVRRLPAETM